MVEISTSLLSVKEENSIKTFYNLEVAKTDYYHIDVMDGKFVEKNNYALMKDYALSLKHITNLPLDVHLMVDNVREAVEDFMELEPHIITFHTEAVKTKEEKLEIIKLIKENNIKVGIAVDISTKVEEIFELLPYVHMVLVMTVKAGMGGQKLCEEAIGKIEKLSKYAKENLIEIDIEADGGIKLDNIKLVKDAGTNIIVVGTYILESKDYSKAIKELKQ